MAQPLPSEILCIVFAHLRHNNLEGFKDYDDLIFATHVCLRWRKAAIDDSSLWDHITVSLVHNAHVLTFIARAKSRPLAIRVIFYGSVLHTSELREFSASLGIISGRWNHIKALSLMCGIHGVSPMLTLASSWIGSSCSNQGLPSFLECLQIHQDLRCTSCSFLDEPLSHPLPESLKAAHLNHSPTPKHFPTLRRMSQLSLSSMSASLPTSDQIFEILRASPYLQVLRLTNLSFITDSWTSLIKPVPLPRLRDLVMMLHMNRPDMLMLFEKLDISRDACIRLILPSHPLMPLPFLPPNFTSTLRTSELSVSMSDGVLTMDLHTIRLDSSVQDATAHIQFTYIDFRPTRKQTAIKVLLKTMECMTWSRPTSFRLSISQCDGDPPTAENWPPLLARLHSLESMKIWLAGGRDSQETWREMNAAISLISALNTPQTEPVLCPHLRRLVFVAIDHKQLTEKVSETIKACVKGRESRGLPYVDLLFWDHHLLGLHDS